MLSQRIPWTRGIGADTSFLRRRILCLLRPSRQAQHPPHVAEQREQSGWDTPKTTSLKCAVRRCRPLLMSQMGPARLGWAGGQNRHGESL